MSNNIPEWKENTNIYEVNLRQYTKEGTINAFASHLPRLKDMGVEALWFMPVTPIAQKYKKGTLGSYYACSDYTSVDGEFGTIEDWKALVKKAQSMGFKIILDWVANHTGWDHKWTVEHPDWYKKDEATGDFKKASGMDDIIELDFSNPSVRKAMIEAMKFWVEETRIDGFRCDLAYWVELNFWIEAKDELEKIKYLFWLGEFDALSNPEYMQVFHAAYTWEWMHTTENFYKEKLHVNDLVSVLLKYQNVPGIKTWFTTNHDENSWNGTEYEKYGAMSQLLSVFNCTWPGLPLVYSGQEIPNLKRLQFFEKDPIEWKEPLELHSFYKFLFQIRKDNSSLNASAGVDILAIDDKIFSYRRKGEKNEVIVVLNFSSTDVEVPGSTIDSGEFKNSSNGSFMDLTQSIFIKKWGWVILEKNQ